MIDVIKESQNKQLGKLILEAMLKGLKISMSLYNPDKNTKWYNFLEK